VNNDCYLVTYAGGTCGAFISALLYLWLNDDPQVLEFPYLGCSHDHDKLLELNWANRDYSSFSEQAYVNNRPLDSSKPFIVRQHYHVDEELLNKLYPRNLHFYISFTAHEKMIIAAFLYFKQFVIEFNSNHNAMSNETKLWFNQFGKIFDPNALSMKQRRLLIESIIDHRFSTQWNHTQPENAVILKLSNILRHPEAIMWQISKAIDKPIPDNVRQTYNNYLEVNKRLIRTETPWIDYFDK
jgi:hypothetical protein